MNLLLDAARRQQRDDDGVVVVVVVEQTKGDASPLAVREMPVYLI